MFLGLGGSRRRPQALGNASQGSAVLLQEFMQAGLQGAVQEDPLQALATGKYAPSRASVSASVSTCLPLYQESLIRSKSLCEDPMVSFGVQVRTSSSFTMSGSPRSTLPSYVPSPNLSRETSRASGESGVSMHGVTTGEEAMSRDCSRFEPAGSRQSQTLALAKKLKNSLGSKFADSLRDTIKEVVMKREKVVMKREEVEGDGDPWPEISQSLDDIATTTGGVSRSESGVAGKSWEACWPVEERNGNATASDHSSMLSFSSGEGLTALDAPGRSESSLKMSFGRSADQSKPSSWLSQENLSQSAIAELSCSPWDAGSRAQVISNPSSSIGSQFFTSDHSSLLGQTNERDMSLGAVLKESGSKGQWMEGLTSSRPPSTRPAMLRRHFPEAAAMGTSRPDSLLRQTGKPNFQSRKDAFGRSKPSVGGFYSTVNKDQSLLDVLKGFQSSGKDCGSFLEFLNPGHPSNRATQKDARQRLYGKSAAADSSEESACKMSGTDWRANASTSYNGAPLLELPESGTVGFDGGVKRARNDVSVESVQLPKRQFMGSNSVLLDVPPTIDAGGGVKSDSAGGRFKEYLASLTARDSRESSYGLPSSSLADLLDDLSQDLLLPHTSS